MRACAGRACTAAWLLGMLLAVSAEAQTDVPPQSAVEPFEFAIVQRGAGISLQEAVQMATEQRPGRVVRAVTVEVGGRRVHEIRILLEEGGRVVTVRIDAQTGESR